MLKNVIDGKTYLDASGDPFKVVGLAGHGRHKGMTMVIYQNTIATKDHPKPFTPLVVTKLQFMKSFKEVTSND